MTDVFFTSDPHLGHGFVAKLRKFDSAEAHDEQYVQDWNAKVTKRDTTWVLGDVTLKNIEAVAPTLRRLNGTKRLVLGNHDRAHPVFRRHYNELRKYLAFFESVELFSRTRINGHEVLMSHFPYNGEGGQRSGEDRYTQYRLRDEGVPLLHGHTHDEKQITSRSANGTPMYHVGWDAHAEPISYQEIDQEMREEGLW